MKITSPFVLLLGSILSLSQATAVPLTQRGIVTLSLKRAPTREDIHPQLVRISFLWLLRTLHNPHGSSSNNILIAQTDVSHA